MLDLILPFEEALLILRSTNLSTHRDSILLYVGDLRTLLKTFGCTPHIRMSLDFTDGELSSFFRDREKAKERARERAREYPKKTNIGEK